MEIETLAISQKADILNVLKQAFASHPILPPGSPVRTTEVPDHGGLLTKHFISVFSQQPIDENSYLDLMLLATAPVYHGQGLGKMMMRILYDFARDKDYHGIILGAAKESTAYHFYIKEGFAVNKEVLFGDIPLCHMQRENVREQ